VEAERSLMSPRIPTNLRVLVEQALARGCSRSFVLEAYGLTYRQLRAILDGMAEPAEGVNADHGSHAGYVRHRSHGEAACDDCRRAESTYSAAMKRSARRRRNLIGKVA
jgi:hypothetical protein